MSADRLLSIDERSRLMSLHRPADQAAFRSAHVLGRHLVAHLAGVPAERVVLWAECARCGGPHGVPRVRIGAATGPSVSLSRSDRVVVAAASWDATVGVDVEALGHLRPGLADVALSPAEARQLTNVLPPGRDDALTRWWVRKEAVLKAAGTGLDTDPRSVVVTGPHQSAELVEWSAPRHPGPVSLRDLDLGAGAAASLAVRSSRPLRLETRQVDLSC